MSQPEPDPGNSPPEAWSGPLTEDEEIDVHIMIVHTREHGDDRLTQSEDTV